MAVQRSATPRRVALSAAVVLLSLGAVACENTGEALLEDTQDNLEEASEAIDEVTQ